MSARHRVEKRSRAAGVVAVPAVAALLAAGIVDQPVSAPAPIAVHQQHRVVSDQQVGLAALALFAVPGAGVQFPPGALDTQDGGIWRRIQDLTVLNDPTRYPGTVTAASVDAGATWLTELILARDPSTTVSGINTGSFGGRVAAEALNRVAATGYDMSSVFGVFYGDSNTPGTGIFARYRPDEPTFGSDVPGGAIPLPDGTYLRINREYDPIAYFPKYMFNPMSWIQLAAGFVFEHSRLQDFDFEDPENVVTVDGNVVTVRVNSPVMPLLMPLKILGAPQRIIDAFQAILQPMVESTGMYETGKVGFLPSPQKLFQQLQAVAAGFEKASQILAGKLPGSRGAGRTAGHHRARHDDRDHRRHGGSRRGTQRRARVERPSRRRGAGPGCRPATTPLRANPISTSCRSPASPRRAPKQRRRRRPLRKSADLTSVGEVAPRTAGTSSP